MKGSSHLRMTFAFCWLGLGVSSAMAHGWPAQRLSLPFLVVAL